MPGIRESEASLAKSCEQKRIGEAVRKTPNGFGLSGPRCAASGGPIPLQGPGPPSDGSLGLWWWTCSPEPSVQAKGTVLAESPMPAFQGHLSGICRLEDQRQKKLSEPRTTVTSALRELSYHACLITIHALKHSCGALRQAGKAPPARRLKASKLQGRSPVDHH